MKKYMIFLLFLGGTYSASVQGKQEISLQESQQQERREELLQEREGWNSVFQKEIIKNLGLSYLTLNVSLPSLLYFLPKVDNLSSSTIQALQAINSVSGMAFLCFFLKLLYIQWQQKRLMNMQIALEIAEIEERLEKETYKKKLRLEKGEDSQALLQQLLRSEPTIPTSITPEE